MSHKKPASNADLLLLALQHGTKYGGSGEIRTHEQITPSPVFKTGAFNRSATLPRLLF
jgi:hypothetical protein